MFKIGIKVKITWSDNTSLFGDVEATGRNMVPSIDESGDFISVRTSERGVHQFYELATGDSWVDWNGQVVVIELDKIGAKK